MWCVLLYDIDGNNWLHSRTDMLGAVRATYGPFSSKRDAKKFAMKWNFDPASDGGALFFAVRRLTMLPEFTKSGLVGAERRVASARDVR